MAAPTSYTRALVTGASSGIGDAYARALAARGTHLVLVARRRDRLEELATALRDRHRVQVEVLPADLTDSLNVGEVAERLQATHEPIDVLVNNAGFGTTGDVVDIDAERLADEIDLNVGALVALSRAALPGMIERGVGAVVNVSSIASFQPAPKLAVYAATKAFVTSFSESLAEEVRHHGVRVQALCPGLTRTEFQETASYNPEVRPSFLWQEADEVVTASLRSLDRGTVLVIPGFHNKAFTNLTGPLPRRLKRRLAALVQERS
jgi:uncharacterized protein